LEINKILGNVLVTVRHLASDQLMKTAIAFEDRADNIYYCWQFNTPSGILIAGKCLPISKSIIDIDPFDFAIKHARIGIGSYRMGREKQFEVISMEKL
jgi:hypothetical protein